MPIRTALREVALHPIGSHPYPRFLHRPVLPPLRRACSPPPRLAPTGLRCQLATCHRRSEPRRRRHTPTAFGWKSERPEGAVWETRHCSWLFGRRTPYEIPLLGNEAGPKDLEPPSHGEKAPLLPFGQASSTEFCGGIHAACAILIERRARKRHHQSRSKS